MCELSTTTLESRYVGKSGGAEQLYLTFELFDNFEHSSISLIDRREGLSYSSS